MQGRTQFQYRLHQACGLLSAKPNKFLRVKQNWVAASENLELRPRLPLVVANQAMRLSHQTDGDLRALSAALYCFQCVVRQRGLLGRLMPPAYGLRHSDLCNNTPITAAHVRSRL